ncbi:ras-related GTP-binding protein D-like [Planoprotostelium fungivorum]|uniref:Endonuclease III homolog n=1 Tax=Planoprotostelium fungivorum TaxID=1890364 RepID=A0A2P6NR77_9EUKA|nr:ras-related GTP-binding protein D-like [Planoprotostelium fungivorum]
MAYASSHYGEYADQFASSFPSDMGYGHMQQNLDSEAPEVHHTVPENKPKILLMGLRRSGKSSIQKVVFHKMPPNETPYLESTNKIMKSSVTSSSFVQFSIWDFPGQIDFFDGTFDADSIFGGAGALVFVLDAQDDYTEALNKLFITVTKARKVNPAMTFEVFIHKVDGLSDELKIDTQRHIQQQATDLQSDGNDDVHLSFYLTSIYDHSIFEAFSKVIQKLITQLPTLENLLDILISNCRMEKAFLIDVVSKIYVATDSSPVDMQTYELCSNMIDVVVNVSSIYGMNDEAMAYDKESQSIIKLNNGMVLYLREVNRYLALVCLLREDNFDKHGLIDYNFQCFKAAMRGFKLIAHVTQKYKHRFYSSMSHNQTLDDFVVKKRKSSELGKPVTPPSTSKSISSRRKSPIKIEYDSEPKSESPSFNSSDVTPDEIVTRSRSKSIKTEDESSSPQHEDEDEELEPPIKVASDDQVPEKMEKMKRETAKTPSPSKKNVYKKVHEAHEKREAPEGWKDTWDQIMEMRKERNAPVDAYGAESLAEKKADPKTFRYQTLLSLLLSSQTKDTITGEAMRNLKQYGCTVDSMLAADISVIDGLIKKVGFHQRKAQYIKDTTKILKEKYEGDIPESLDGLLELPGIGPKMAFLIMQCAWDKSVGIGVDVHVHRISNRLRWVKNTKSPEDTRKELESWLPEEHWNQINILLVGFGQQICTPTYPKCKGCLLNTSCPSAFKESSKK